MKVNPRQQGILKRIIDDLFWSLKAKVLGRFFKGPKIYFEVVEETNPLETIEGIYKYTQFMFRGPDAKPDEKRIKTLAGITSNYIEAERLKTQNQVLATVEQSESYEDLSTNLSEQLDKTHKNVHKILVTETRNIQSNAEAEGITEVAASLGVEDPIVVKRGVIDEKMCKNCRKLWHTKANVYVPKVYKLSELQAGYNKDWKNPIPTINSTHPNCRHVLSYIPPNFGFDSKGQLVFKGFGHDAYETQEGEE